MAEVKVARVPVLGRHDNVHQKRTQPCVFTGRLRRPPSCDDLQRHREQAWLWSYETVVARAPWWLTASGMRASSARGRGGESSSVPRVVTFIHISTRLGNETRGKTIARHSLLWRQKNPGIAVQHIRAREGEALLRTHYNEFYSCYDSLQTGVERSDFLRYLAIHHYGGVYADEDVVPIWPVERWATQFGWRQRLDNLLIVGMEDTRPLRLCQFVFASAPRHPLLWAMALEVRSRVNRLASSHRFSVLERTGPVAWTAAIVQFVARHAPAGERNLSSVDERTGRLIHLNVDGRWWKLLVLPYRAFGFNRAHDVYLQKEPR